MPVKNINGAGLEFAKGVSNQIMPKLQHQLERRAAHTIKMA
jgi:hypothetical protein